MLKFARVLGKQHNRKPPRLLRRRAFRLHGLPRCSASTSAVLGRDDMREFLRIAGINIFDVLEETFESPLLKGALALDAVLGTNLGPRSNNSVLALLHRLSGQASGQRRRLDARGRHGRGQRGPRQGGPRRRRHDPHRHARSSASRSMATASPASSSRTARTLAADVVV